MHPHSCDTLMANLSGREFTDKRVRRVTAAEETQRKALNCRVCLLHSTLQPFQTMVRGVSALRDDDKKEEKVSRPRETHSSLVDWAKSGGMEGFSLRGALRLPSFKVRTRSAGLWLAVLAGMTRKRTPVPDFLLPAMFRNMPV